MAYQTPKTDWTAADGVTDIDMNRIEGNAAALKNAATIDIADAGNIITATNVEGALQEIGADLVSGKSAMASSLTAMNQASTTADSVATMATKVRAISNDATAQVGQVLSGQTFYQGGIKRTGTMPNIGDSWQAANSVESYVDGNGKGVILLRPPEGYYKGVGEAKTYAIDQDFTYNNIRTGVNIFGMQGNFTSDATASAWDMVSGKTAYVNGNIVTGTLPERATNGYENASSTSSSGQTLYIRIPAGAYRQPTGIGTPEITAWDANFVDSNIRAGTSIFGKTGTMYSNEAGIMPTNSLGIGSPNSTQGYTYREKGVITRINSYNSSDRSIRRETINRSGTVVSSTIIATCPGSATYGYVYCQPKTFSWMPVGPVATPVYIFDYNGTVLQSGTLQLTGTSDNGYALSGVHYNPTRRHFAVVHRWTPGFYIEDMNGTKLATLTASNSSDPGNSFGIWDNSDKFRTWTFASNQTYEWLWNGTGYTVSGFTAYGNVNDSVMLLTGYAVAAGIFKDE